MSFKNIVKYIVILIFILFFVTLLSNSYAKAVDKEVVKYINSLSKEQLFDLYAEQVITMAFDLVPKYNYLKSKVKHKAKQCIIDSLNELFTRKEMIDLYLQPPDMDFKFYTNKIDQSIAKYIPCFESILENQ
ncbi:MAG: hypothetical protein LBI10_00840 [Deltaproteobacteria bacterium]|jgi:hypothetical protein|nr:hypothetical protein [Deltaproteobacteria bacterium]